MKKLSVIVALLALFAIPQRTNGQAALLVLLFGDQVASEDLYFSLKVGGNLSNLTNTEESKAMFGTNFGLLVNIKLSDQFYLVPELAPLSNKGASNIVFHHQSGNDDFDNLLANNSHSEFQLNYIDIPVMLKYYPTPHFNIGVGPYISILSSADNYFEVDAGSAGDLKLFQDLKSSMNKIDYGFMVEAGYAPWRELPNDDLNFHVRFAYGLNDIFKDDARWDSIKNYTLQFFVSMPFIKTGEEE